MQTCTLYFIILTLVGGLSQCASNGENSEYRNLQLLTKADSIVDQAIKKAGGDSFVKMHIEFDFRDRHYVGKRNFGAYTYERIFTGPKGVYRDVLDNNGFERFLDEKKIDVIDTMAAKYTRSVNSVLYFGLLPFGLQDPAVNREYLGENTVKGNTYHKIKVTFKQDQGGEDFQDVFVYWFDKQSFDMDYFAYYYVTDGGGTRFREAYNQREIKGLVFRDYINYKPPTGLDLPLEKYDSLFETGQLEKLSKIETEKIEVHDIGQ